MKIILNLNKKEILEKKININLKGYDVYEIDHFLDIIYKDYDSWEIMLKNSETKLNILKTEIQNIKKENIKLENHIKKYKKELKILEEKNIGNIDILKRINKLEETS